MSEAQADPLPRKLRKGTIVTNPVSGTRYRVAEMLGEGGYGHAYRAFLLDTDGEVEEEVCLKTTLDVTSWHREAYFGELLGHSRRVIHMFESFPLPPTRTDHRMLFCLVLELAEHGTIADYPERTGKPWPAKRAVREICALLRLLDQLHGGSATHRDITPANVFVTGRGTLKLGDFGIARHQLPGSPVTIDAFNPVFVTKGFVDGASRYWTTVDDVYQMGQLLSMLLSGDAETIIKPAMVRKIDCDEALHTIIRRAIGPKKDRFEDAFEMLQALLEDTEDEQSLRTIRGKTVAFTGPLSITRFDAEVLVLQSGGRVAPNVTRSVDVVVQGGRSLLYRGGGHKGRKMQKVEELRKRGHRISIIGEAEFRRLTRQKL